MCRGQADTQLASQFPAMGFHQRYGDPGVHCTISKSPVINSIRAPARVRKEGGVACRFVARQIGTELTGAMRWHAGSTAD